MPDNTEQELNKVSDIVLDLLKKDERTRNDDKWLCYQVTRKFTNIFIPFEDFDKFPSWESVTRCRRDWQNSKGVYIPTDPKVAQKRGIREEVFRKYFGRGY